ncbi:COX15/CtaA family protein [Nocardioides yefusunii]|uniref:Heme A synthase n=1 Tax=Nocardioides yefusunii TaxID=2500546 RepID=A0ABW1QSS4_9ACTN|nr:COX15/CtaA family protein [Nocardioides yefusunii]
MNTRDNVVGTATTGFTASPWALRWLRPLALANLVANILIVVTGGIVRLTGSGLGCDTWPKCTEDRYTAHAETGIHGAIEFGNRMLTWILVALAIAFVVAAFKSNDRRTRILSVLVAVGIPLQAVLGGITVLTDLNPWVVSLHLMASMLMIAFCVLALDHLSGSARPAAPALLGRLAWALLLLGWVILYLGTIVTGSGPHAGDVDAKRNGLSPENTAKIHAWTVYLLCLGTVVLLWLSRRRGLTLVLRAGLVLLGVELFQGVVGYVQYFNGLPEVLVIAHMLGAGLLSAAVTWVVLATQHSDGGVLVGTLTSAGSDEPLR